MERKLTEIFGRSRPTVQEALRMLEKDGLVSVVGSGGAVVCEPTTTQLKQPLEMDTVTNQIIALEEIQNHLERFLRLDQDFHEVVAKAGNNRICEILIHVLREPMLDTIAVGFSKLHPRRLAREQDVLIATHKKNLRAVSS